MIPIQDEYNIFGKEYIEIKVLFSLSEGKPQNKFLFTGPATKAFPPFLRRA